jgi:hypothetical protein
MEPQLTIPIKSNSKLRPDHPTLVIPDHSKQISQTFNRFNQLLRIFTCTALSKIGITK